MIQTVVVLKVLKVCAPAVLALPQVREPAQQVISPADDPSWTVLLQLAHQI